MANQEVFRQDVIVNRNLGIGKTAGTVFNDTFEIIDANGHASISLTSLSTLTGQIKFINDSNVTDGAISFDHNSSQYTFNISGTPQITISPTTTTIRGDLVVQGTSTTVDSKSLQISDLTILVNKDETGSGITDPSLFAGIEIDRGTATNALWGFNEQKTWWEPRDLPNTSGALATFKKLGNIQTIDATTAGNVLTISATGGLVVPIGTTANRPSSPINGLFRYSTTNNSFEGYINGAWTALVDNNTISAGYVAVSGDTMTGNLVMGSTANIQMTNGSILGSSGSLSNPSFSFSTDTNTGLRSVSDGSMSLVSNGVDAFMFNNLQAFGMNTVPTSDARFAISDSGFFATTFTGNQKSQIKIVGQNTNDWARISFGDTSSHDYASVGVQRTASGSILSIGTSNNFASGVTNQAINVMQNGFVGINTTTATTFQLEIAGDIGPDSDLTRNLGSASRRFNTIYGTATEAMYADLAERYEADDFYEPGTVLVFGGEKEVTTTQKEFDVSIAGVVSTKPGVLINATAGDNRTHPCVALKGRVPCKVIGPVKKGDLLVTSSRPGYAKACDKNNLRPYTVLGKSLQNFTPTNEFDSGVIEIAVI